MCTDEHSSRENKIMETPHTPSPGSMWRYMQMHQTESIVHYIWVHFLLYLLRLRCSYIAMAGGKTVFHIRFPMVHLSLLFSCKTLSEGMDSRKSGGSRKGPIATRSRDLVIEQCIIAVKFLCEFPRGIKSFQYLWGYPSNLKIWRLSFRWDSFWIPLFFGQIRVWLCFSSGKTHSKCVAVTPN